MKKLLIGAFLALFALSVNASIINIDGGTFDGTDVGAEDILLATDNLVNNGEATETAWVNTQLGTTADFFIKNETIAYYLTTDPNVVAFELTPDNGMVGDYFLVKQGEFVALYENLDDMMWGVFDYVALTDFKFGDDFTISHVSQFNGDDVSAVPLPATIYLFGSALFGFIGFKRLQK